MAVQLGQHSTGHSASSPEVLSRKLSGGKSVRVKTRVASLAPTYKQLKTLAFGLWCELPGHWNDFTIPDNDGPARRQTRLGSGFLRPLHGEFQKEQALPMMNLMILPQVLSFLPCGCPCPRPPTPDPPSHPSSLLYLTQDHLISAFPSSWRVWPLTWPLSKPPPTTHLLSPALATYILPSRYTTTSAQHPPSTWWPRRSRAICSSCQVRKGQREQKNFRFTVTCPTTCLCRPEWTRGGPQRVTGPSPLRGGVDSGGHPSSDSHHTVLTRAST